MIILQSDFHLHNFFIILAENKIRNPILSCGVAQQAEAKPGETRHCGSYFASAGIHG